MILDSKESGLTQPYFRWRNVQYERANSRQKSAYFFSAQHKAAVISPGMLNSFSGASLSSPPSFPRLAHMLHAFTPLPSFSSFSSSTLEPNIYKRPSPGGRTSGWTDGRSGGLHTYSPNQKRTYEVRESRTQNSESGSLALSAEL